MNKINQNTTKIGTAIIVTALCSFLCGCNTFEGVGADIKGAGKAIEDTAADAKNGNSNKNR